MSSDEDTPDLASDELMLSLKKKDHNVEIVGYVDEIHSIKEVGSKKKLWMFKFFLSNGNYRVQIIVFTEIKPGLKQSDTIVGKYEKEIKMKRIVHIDGGLGKLPDENYFDKSSNNLIFYEIKISDRTIVEYYGYFTPELAGDASIIDVDFDTIEYLDFEGVTTVRINGYIKTCFKISFGMNKNNSYGIGALCDLKKKISIQIANFSDSNLEKGTPVTLIGRAKLDFGCDTISIVCESMSCIEIDPTKSKASIKKLIRATEQVTRKIRRVEEKNAGVEEESEKDLVEENIGGKKTKGSEKDSGKNVKNGKKAEGSNKDSEKNMVEKSLEDVEANGS